MKLSRRALLAGSIAASLGYTTARAQRRRLFDSHLHIIDHRFPIIPNQGYTPPHYSLADYREQVKSLGVTAGAVVSGSFQGHDQTYLIDALRQLGPGWAGVTQIPNDTPDAEIARLGALGVRAVRFNILRGLTDSVDEIVALATRCHAVAGWHCELYVDAAALKPHIARLSKLPQIAIDHLGMRRRPQAHLLVLLELSKPSKSPILKLSRPTPSATLWSSPASSWPRYGHSLSCRWSKKVN